MSELVEKWEPTGLLHDLENKQEVAESIEEAYAYLKEKADGEEEPSDEFEWASGIILPAVSRLYYQESLEVIGIDVDEISEVDGEKLAKTFLEKAEHYKGVMEETDSYYQLDAEAEVTQMFVEWYILNHLSE